jgi:hypothetical protein
VGAVVVVVAEGTVAPVGAAGAFPTTSGVPATSTWVGEVAGAGGAGLVGAAGVVTRLGVAEPFAGGPPAGLTDPPLMSAVVTRPITAEVRLESTARVPSARLGVPVSDAELVPTTTGEPEAPFDAVVELIVPASAVFAYMPEANTLTVAITPKN